MSYDNPDVRQYDFGVIDFGTGTDIVHTIEVPQDGGAQGRSGRVVDVILSQVTEDFAGSTSDAGVQVGDGTDADKYYDTGLVLDESVDVADNAILHLEDDGAKVDIEYNRSTVTVTFVAAQGTPTGQAAVSVVIEWD
jgi:hypothetical protein